MKKKVKETPIGERIREVFVQSKMTVDRFAELLNCNCTQVYNIFRRKKIDIYQLLEISKALKHNFIAEICANREHAGKPAIIVIEIRCTENDTFQKLLKALKQLNINVLRK